MTFDGDRHLPGPDRGEQVLHGGTANRGLVVRVGDTVRRPRRPTSPATHALLRHLADVGFEGAPRLLGVDELGREVLTYVPGDTVVPPYPTWALTDRALVSVAELMRRYHHAVTSFDPTGFSWPKAVPDAFRSGLVSHNDPNLDNIVFRDGLAVALIDFDLAGPGSRVFDVAAAARLWAPLRTAADIDDDRRGLGLVRFRLFVEASGLAAADRSRLMEAVIANHDWTYDILRTAAAHGHGVFADYLAAGAARRAARSRRWYVSSTLLREALR